MQDIASHMREYALATMGRALYDVTFNEMMRPYAHALSIGQAALGAEVGLKARIAEQGLFKLFLPNQAFHGPLESLSLEELLERGRTPSYAQLPHMLEELTGVVMGRKEEFLAFGRMRNRVVHLSPHVEDASGQTMKFLLEVMEPLVSQFWGESIIDWSQEWDEAIIVDGYLEDQMESHGVVLGAEGRVALAAIRARRT